MGPYMEILWIVVLHKLLLDGLFEELHRARILKLSILLPSSHIVTIQAYKTIEPCLINGTI